MRLGERENAKSLVLTLLAARERSPRGEDQDATLSTAGVLVTSYLNDEMWTEALPLQEGIVTLLRAQRSGTDREMLLACSLLAVMLVEAGELTRSRVLLQVTANAFAKAFGRADVETLRMFLLLGLVLERQEDTLGARAVIERSFDLARTDLGEDHEITVRFGTKLACLLLRASRHTEARAVLMDVLPVSERTTGRERATTLTNLNNLAVAIWNQGQKTTRTRGKPSSNSSQWRQNLSRVAETRARSVLPRSSSGSARRPCATRQ